MARRLENWVQAYVKHTQHSESPDSFHFWTAVATVAGALRRRVWRNELTFQWTPNFYIILVGPPGVAAKSTSIRGGLSLLERVPGIRFGPQSATWQALLEAFSEATEAVDIGGTFHTMSCMTCAISELGTFLRTDDKDLVAQLIAMWDGQLETFGRRTKKDGNVQIQNPWMNIIGCTTPSWFRDNCPISMIDGGLFSRIMFIYGDKKRRLVAYPSREKQDAHHEAEKADLIADLESIAQLAGPYELTEDAYAWGTDWYRQLHEERPEHLRGDRFGGYVARKQGHMHKLAMVLAASKRDSLVIEKADLREADYYLSLVERDMVRVFEAVGQASSVRTSSEVLSLIKTAGKIEYSLLWVGCQHSLSHKDFLAALQGLLETKWVHLKQEGDKKYVIYTGPKKPTT